MPLSLLVQALGPEVEDVQAIFRSVARKTPAMQTKLDKCLNKWNQLWSSSHVYIERLKCVEIVLTGLEEATTVVSEFELKLASYEELPSNVEALQVVSFMNTSWQATLSSMMIITMMVVVIITTTTTNFAGGMDYGLSCNKLSSIFLFAPMSAHICISIDTFCLCLSFPI